MGLLYSVRQEIKSIFIKFQLRDQEFNAGNNIVIFSEARGGSTWLMECLAQIPGAIINWEPLHVTKGVVPSSWGDRPYIGEESDKKEYRSYLGKIFSLSNTNRWTLGRNEMFGVKGATRVITKFVRANLLMPFIMDSFELDNRAIFLLRHPLDVCLSQLKAFDRDKADVLRFPTDNTQARYEQHRVYLLTLENNLEKKIAIWCINNVEVINRLHEYEDRLIVVDYHKLVMKPRTEYEQILKRLEVENIEGVLSTIDFERASKTTLDKKKFDPAVQLRKNFNTISTEQKDRIQEIFDHFELTYFRASSPY